MENNRQIWYQIRFGNGVDVSLASRFATVAEKEKFVTMLPSLQLMYLGEDLLYADTADIVYGKLKDELIKLGKLEKPTLTVVK